MTEITEKRLYNLKKWIKDKFDETIDYSSDHLVWGCDPESEWNRVYIEPYPPYTVYVWDVNKNWTERGTIEDWD